MCQDNGITHDSKLSARQLQHSQWSGSPEDLTHAAVTRICPPETALIPTWHDTCQTLTEHAWFSFDLVGL